jgi:GT2 family glycosyltransferase/glycosyltransferase involved in cell wall biosynthesis
MDSRGRGNGDEDRPAGEEQAEPAPAAPRNRRPSPRVETDSAALQAELTAARARIRELERTLTSLTSGIAQIEQDVERIAASRAWRWGHAVSRLGRRLLRRPALTAGGPQRVLERIGRIRGSNALLPGPVVAPVTLPPLRPHFSPDAVARAEGPRRARLAADLRARLGPAPDRADWPRVSLIVISHDGHEQLARLLEGVANATDYPDLELIVVDNGSERPLEPLVGGGPVPGAVTLRLDANESFSDANNRGAEVATGDVLVFLNDDIEPFEPGWCQELVALTLADGVGAAGATLLHVAYDPSLTASGWIVQHRGIRFRLAGHLPRAFNHGDGDDLLDAQFGRDYRCPAVTGACLAIRRDAFVAAGGFSAGYRFGTEDVDLCLKLLDSGHDVALSGRSVLFHRESLTQSMVSRVEIADNRRINRLLFHQTWGARLRRELRRARLTGDAYWTPERAHIGVSVSSVDPADGWGDWYTAHELSEALAALGLRATMVPRKGAQLHPPPDDLDALVSLMDTFDLAPLRASVLVLAWVRNWTHRWMTRAWFGRVDVFLSSAAGSAEVLEELAGVPSMRFPLATNPDQFRDPGGAGGNRVYDYVLTANRWGVERSIEHLISPRAGERVALFGRGWEGVPALAEYWRGPVPYERLPGVYGAARIVLDDTAGPTLPYGALNGRVFDALAAGSLVLTNCAAGAAELFDADFPTWTDATDLRAALDHLLADEDRRAELAARYRATVLGAHTYAHRAARLTEIIADRGEALSFVIRIGAPDWDRAQRWGDLHFAQAIERELKRRGHRCLIQVLAEWEELEGSCYDVSLVLRGRSAHRPKPGQLNVLWSISHPAELTGSECDGYDLVAVASPIHAEAVAGSTHTPVFVLEQATDPRRFYPDPDPAVAHELVFVGNSRGVRRRALHWLGSTDRDLAVWGGDWDGLIDTRLVAGEFIDNDELRHVYSSAQIVLADHWDDMRAHGYVSNRIFDALACGAVVLSDTVAGLPERFGDAVAVYSSPEELNAQIDRLLSDGTERAGRAARGREAVLEGHTFAHRVEELLARVYARRDELGLRTRIGPPARRPAAGASAAGRAGGAPAPA